MANALADQRIPMQVRVNLSNAALRYANALVSQNKQELEAASFDMSAYAADVRLCLRAAEMGMGCDD